MFVFELPEIGEGVVEGEIVRWLVQEGAVIATDDRVCEIMTDKATVEITSPRSGKVIKLYGGPGDVVKVHAPLMDLDDGSAAAAPQAPAKAHAAPPVAAPAAPASPPVAAAPAAPPIAAAPKPPVAAAPPAAARPAEGPAKATPAVRSHARTMDVDINAVPATGKGGRVTREDVDSFVSAPAAAPAPLPVAPVALPAPAPSAGDERIKIIGLRRKISEKMVESYRRIPHFTYVDEVDATALVALREQLKGPAEQAGVKLSYLPFIMKALVAAFRKFPTVNAVMDEAANELVVRRDVHIGIATDTDAGLYVPVIKDVARKPILQLAREIAELTDRTRAGKAGVEELTGGTFTITSVGNIGGRFATPIINAPEVAILGVNQIHERPMVVDGQIVARKMMYLSPSFDHRVIDGAVAARFVSEVKALLESPQRLYLEM
ncbi:MAG: 2-oxo acid dehydrogenase subunit E2 [Deltaproteobacteria bacterium]|nr:2-oxo acid dehydrogenase subunit E2 [Deltaproteobacteria bacterium]